jgi:hypothetical protein
MVKTFSRRAIGILEGYHIFHNSDNRYVLGFTRRPLMQPEPTPWAPNAIRLRHRAAASLSDIGHAKTTQTFSKGTLA